MISMLAMIIMIVMIIMIIMVIPMGWSPKLGVSLPNPSAWQLEVARALSEICGYGSTDGLLELGLAVAETPKRPVSKVSNPMTVSHNSHIHNRENHAWSLDLGVPFFETHPI